MRWLLLCTFQNFLSSVVLAAVGGDEARGVGGGLGAVGVHRVSAQSLHPHHLQRQDQDRQAHGRRRRRLPPLLRALRLRPALHSLGKSGVAYT